VPELILKPGREKSLLRHHPWVFSGAVAKLRGDVEMGGTVDIISDQGIFLGRSAFNPVSQIAGRVWTWEADEEVNSDFFQTHLTRSINARNFTCPEVSPLGAVRLVYAESDGLPGLIVDRYGNILVVQFLSAGAEFWRSVILDKLQMVTGISDIYERSDVDVRRLEGFAEKTGVLRGLDPPDKLIIEENGLHLEVNISQGHKTGFYLDQRLNRLKIRDFAKNKDVLDCFCYTGGFSLNAIAGGAKSLLAIDASESAISQAKDNLILNSLDTQASVEWSEVDVFKELRTLRDKNVHFDLIILDPPKFAHTLGQVERAARGYKDINLLAMKLLRPGGILVTFSCSGGVPQDLFQKIVAGAALDAQVDIQILEWLHQSPDHPVALNFPESAYLKGFVLRVG
jgi:23S rRNA (cytosine1962-C5)-methyltransferase